VQETPNLGKENQAMKYDIFDRGFASVTRATAVVAVLCFAAVGPLMAADQRPTNTPAMTPAPVAAPPKGEFDTKAFSWAIIDAARQPFWTKDMIEALIAHAAWRAAKSSS